MFTLKYRIYESAAPPGLMPKAFLIEKMAIRAGAPE
jgi:hypothetical protein